MALYAPKVGTWRADSAHVLDRYILAKLAVLRDELTASMDGCDISGVRAVAAVHRGADELVCATFTFAVLGGPDAIDTLHTVLEVTATLAAPPC